MNGQREVVDPVRVVFVVFSLRGGMTQYSAQLANALAEYATVTVIAPDSSEARELYDDDVQFKPLPKPGGGILRTAVTLGGVFVALNRHLVEARPDVIHLPFLAGLPSILSLPLLWLYRRPLVGTVHDPVSHEGHEIGLFGIDLRVAVIRFETVLLDAVVVHGEECERQALEAGYPSEKLCILPHGLYTHFEDADSGADPVPVSGTEPVLLFFGKIRPNKGFDRIPAIVDGVAEEVGNVRAVVAGSSDVGWQIDEDELDRIVAALDEHDRIEFEDRYVPNEEVGGYFRNATAVVLPYYDATASGVAMTAYTFETPMVATRTGDMGRMIERDETGVLADPDATDDLVDGAVEVLTDPALRDRLTDNIRENRPEYAWGAIAEQTVSLYRRLSA